MYVCVAVPHVYLPLTDSVIFLKGNTVHFNLSLILKQSNISSISTVGQTYNAFQICNNIVIHTSWAPFQRKGYRMASLFIVLHFCTLSCQVCASVEVTWEQLSDVWMDKRSWMHAVTVNWCLCCGSTAPSHGSTEDSLSRPLCCEWQWSKLPQESQ